MEIEILYYETETGKQPYKDWQNGLKNLETVAKIKRRLERVEEGNFGDYRHIEGKMFELRFKFGSGLRIFGSGLRIFGSGLRIFGSGLRIFGSGLRIYFGQAGNEIIILLCGGDKGSQKRDIKKAKEYWKDYCSGRLLWQEN